MDPPDGDYEGGSGHHAYEAALRLKEDMEVVRKMRDDARAKCQAAHSEDKVNV
jgi:predicted nucleic acid-binding Zn ribbon protein